jgi:hypothetical protein
MMDTKVVIKCLCGKRVTLDLIGGQYQDEFQGDCKCGRKWLLKEISESLEEIDSE